MSEHTDEIRVRYHILMWHPNVVSHPDTVSYSDAVSHSEAMWGGSQTNREFSSKASRKVYLTHVHEVRCSFVSDRAR